ncbi:MAG: glycosyltransferase family 4 protein [Armatimonadetes bacterium]|nr:glycosyltransferase family 4 protein [Armatimonadota bacterium]
MATADALVGRHIGRGMRILFANKFWYRRGGLERVMFDEIEWLQDAGHEIAHFSTTHPRNDPSPWADYFVPYLELGEAGGLSSRQKLMAAARLFHNGVAARQFSRLLEDFRPDVVHAHGIHRQISTSILGVARRRQVPVVHSLHDYHLICPADVLLYRGSIPCQPRRCGSVWFGPCVTGRCVRGSLPASALSAAEITWARVRRAYTRGIDRFICPSEFTRAQMQNAGWKTPMDVIRNAVPVDPVDPRLGDYFLVIGRLSREKGVEISTEAAVFADVPLVVAGDGPLRQSLEAKYPRATFTGHLPTEEVLALIHGARAVVVPSLALENAPMSVLEPMTAGVPVIASRTGGIPEQVTDGVDGLLVPPGDAEALGKAMQRLAKDGDLARRLGARARMTVAQRFSVAEHVTALERTYQAAVRI